ncbi:protoporphyrinogen oxidase [Bradyrhizobium sp.]|uniref:protoporphyrinogen oxidase n=1 Tax=Bradyrhizobium sp. TaxID=376 RepID=UPI0040384490
MTSCFDVVVLGAGLSGLTAAHRLQTLGLDVLVLDRRSYAGGRAHTEHIDGFLMEHGPTSMVGPASAVEQLIADLDLSGERVERGLGVRNRYLVRDGRLHALPIDPARFFLSSFFSLSARLRLLLEPIIPGRAGDESVASFVRRRFGNEMLDYLFNPLVGGLFAGAPEALSVAAAFPELKRLELQFGSVLKGIAASRFRGDSGNRFFGRRTLFSFRDGMSALPRALAARLGRRLRLGHMVKKLAWTKAGEFLVKSHTHDGDYWFSARSVIVALPSYGAAAVIEPIDQDVASTLRAIEHPPLAVVLLGYRREDIPHPLDGLGFLAPEVERRSQLGMLFSSTLFPVRAPQGYVALTATVGGARQPEFARLPEADLRDRLHGEAVSLLDARRPPVLTRTRYWTRGLPQYSLGHIERMHAVRDLEKELPGLFFTGNYISGISTTNCIAQAIEVADRAAHFRSASILTRTAFA